MALADLARLRDLPASGVAAAALGLGHGLGRPVPQRAELVELLDASGARRASSAWYSASGTAAPARPEAGLDDVRPLPEEPGTSSTRCARRCLRRARQAHDAVVGLDVDDADAPRVAALGGDVRGVEADQLPLGRDEQDVVARRAPG